MTNNNLKLEDISIDQIFLNERNPRFEPVGTEKEAIECLCTEEYVYELAADIVKQGGINPLEHFALILRDKKDGAKLETYTIIEGNRRLCALKLLNDPNLAPNNLRKKFETLSENWTRKETIPAVIFSDFDSAKIWLERMHDSQRDVGRRRWNAEQKQRFFNSEKNRFAQALLDYAERNRFITKIERKGKLTTVGRFITNKKFQECIGLNKSDPEKFQSTLPDADFERLIKQFINDLKGGENVHSRMNKDDIEAYAQKLKSGNNNPSPPPLPTLVRPLPPPALNLVTKKKGKPKRPATSKFITYDPDIKEALDDLGADAYKLQSFYYSITELELEDHTPTLCICVWAFFETLTAYAGRKDGTAFTAYLNKNKLKNTFKFTESNIKAIREALGRISGYGNTTKHHKIAALFNGEQLSNDMEVLREVILKTIEEARSNKF